MRAIVNSLRNLLGGRASEVVAPAARRCVVDPGSGSKGRERLPPGVQVKMLQRLGRFAEKEELTVDVVLEGKDLRAVQDGGEFQGVTVHFAATPAEVRGVALKLVNDSSRGTPVVMITDDVEIEKPARSAGAQVMRLTTLEKVFEGGLRRGGGGGGNSDGHRSVGRGGSRNRRRRSDDQPRMSKQGGSDKDPVRDMLDLVE